MTSELTHHGDSDLQQKVEKLTLKISCLETSLKFESRKAKRLEQELAIARGNRILGSDTDDRSNGLENAHLDTSAQLNEYDERIARLEKQLRERDDQFQQLHRDYKELKQMRLNELDMRERIQVCVQVLKHIVDERSKQKLSAKAERSNRYHDKNNCDDGGDNVYGDDVDEKDEDLKWFDREEYYHIALSGKVLFRELIYRDEQFAKMWKRDMSHRENQRMYDRTIISQRGIRKERVDHMNHMLHKMAHYNPEYSLSINGDNLSIESSKTKQTEEFDNEPVMEQVSNGDQVNRTSKSTLLNSPIYCYICKRKYFEVDEFYDKLCKHCSALNYEKRLEKCDLTGRIAIVTGGRIRIGYQTAIRLLRNNCTKVIVITRFPQNALKRFSTETDFETFRDRLLVYGLDLRDVVAVEQFCKFMYKEFDHLDILINNAAQTIRRPPLYYASLIKEELSSVEQLPNHLRSCLCEGKLYSSKEMIGQLHQNLAAIVTSQNEEPSPANLANDTSSPSASSLSSTSIEVLDPSAHRAVAHLETVFKNRTTLPAALLSAIPRIEEDLNSDPAHFPLGERDDQLDQLDKRHQNTWKTSIDSVSSVEALEVQMCNVMAPFILVQQLKRLFERSPHTERFIVNVSSVEGLFSKNYKQKYGHHPHTNMSKSSLNMLTMTTAPKYAMESQIYMTCVDPGWVSQLCPYPQANHNKVSHNFEPPLDEVDGASRITHPIFESVKHKQHLFGVFLKDYETSDW